MHRPARPIEVDVSQDNFAAMANLARTTAGMVLRKLEADGRVEVAYRRHPHPRPPTRSRAVLRGVKTAAAARARRPRPQFTISQSICFGHF